MEVPFGYSDALAGGSGTAPRRPGRTRWSKGSRAARPQGAAHYGGSTGCGQGARQPANRRVTGRGGRAACPPGGRRAPASGRLVGVGGEAFAAAAGGGRIGVVEHELVVQAPADEIDGGA